MDYQEFIKPELLILIPVLYLVGIGIKKSAIRDKFIPLILGGVGIVLSLIYVFAFSMETITAQTLLQCLFIAITQGILCAGASVYINQIIKQSQKEE